VKTPSEKDQKTDLESSGRIKKLSRCNQALPDSPKRLRWTDVLCLCS